jgi:hypothetical protein
MLSPDNVFQSRQESCCSCLFHISEGIGQCCKVWEQQHACMHTQVWNWNCLIGKARKKQSMNLSKLEKNKKIPWKSLYKFCWLALSNLMKECWISVTPLLGLNFDTTKINDQMDNCPIQTQMEFFWDSIQANECPCFCVQMDVCLTCAIFRKGGIDRRRAKWERESHVILCSTLQLWHGGIWPQPIRTMSSAQLSFPGAPSSEDHHLSLTWWAFSTFVHILPLPHTHSDLFFYSLLQTPKNKKKTYYVRVRF